ncbi:ABC transporter ATP-binding protein [Enterovibrio sp. ZSDZ35]|uniref:ABC-type dipeptide transporter n=1 Tax=Enterovibrio qingdaonensis TaxID=2899818 RepID=A0ABT5QPA7_9GAMM|nr:ABC transporter ATP-binding protein [Enterovibrio sp. ZSDZ35]MDD1782812.1 ABC transporter ATP-binding protein [Enterovibrio sp. ZSDZ35]
MTKMLLDVHQLQVTFNGFPAVNDVSFGIKRGEVLGVVGESGCGKSLMSLALIGLQPSVMRVGGEVHFNGQNVLSFDRKKWQRIRGDGISMIFQEPMTALNPVITIGDQVAEMFELHRGCDKATAKEKAIAILRQVHIPDAKTRFYAFPHELSGGMRQRVMIAMALACQPELIIADEPTTALDVTVQAQVLDLLEDLRESTGAAIMFISHNLGVVSQIADRVIVMYAGKIVEQAPADVLFANPRHPYTQGLIASFPTMDESRGELYAIPGTVPPLEQRLGGCVFADRCSKTSEKCLSDSPRIQCIDPEHTVACHYV